VLYQSNHLLRPSEGGSKWNLFDAVYDAKCRTHVDINYKPPHICELSHNHESVVININRSEKVEPNSLSEIMRGQTAINFLQRSASKKETNIFELNYRELARNWEACRTALYLTYGEIKSNAYGPNNRHILKMALKFVMSAIRDGLRNACKTFSGWAREAVMSHMHKMEAKRHLGIRSTKGREHALFLASGLSRAITVRPRKEQKEEVKEEATACIRRITTRTPMPCDETQISIVSFIHELFHRRAKYATKVLERRGLPLPQPTKVVEASVREGGGLIAYRLYGRAAVPSKEERLEKLTKERADARQWIETLAVQEDIEAHAVGQGDNRWNYIMDQREDMNPDRDEMNDLDMLMYEALMDCEEGEMIALPELPTDGPLFRTAGIVREKQEAFDKETARLAEIEPPVEHLSLQETFLNALKDAPNSRECEILPIVDQQGKIRIATCHSASVTWCARAMSQFLFPHLKHLKFSRNALLNEKIVLVNHDSREKFIFSADFSKSTDPISIELARLVFDAVISHLPKPEWWDDAVYAVINPHLIINAMMIDETLDELPSTTCGALMGLGPGWLVLCLLNAYCAESAGAKHDSYRVCGDDLVGLWTQTTIARYQQNVEELGLKLNERKSFRSRDYGVFCERLVIRRSAHTATAEHEMRLGQASLCKAETANGRCTGLGAVDTLMSSNGHPLIRQLARTVCRRTAPSATAPGKLEEGGGGLRQADAVTVVAYAQYGPTQLREGETLDGVSELRKSLRPLPTRQNGVSCQEVLNIFTEHAERRSRVQHGLKTTPSELIPTDTIKRRIHSRRHQAKLKIAQCGGPVNAIREIATNPESRAYVRGSPKVWKRTMFHLRCKRFSKALATLRTSWRTRVDATQARLLLEEACGGRLEYVTLDLKSRSQPCLRDSPPA
jgi:hypothetical protein